MTTGNKEGDATPDQAYHHGASQYIPVNLRILLNIKHYAKPVTERGGNHGCCHAEKEVHVDGEALRLGVRHIQQHRKARRRPSLPYQIIESNHRNR